MAKRNRKRQPSGTGQPATVQPAGGAAARERRPAAPKADRAGTRPGPSTRPGTAGMNQLLIVSAIVGAIAIVVVAAAIVLTQPKAAAAQPVPPTVVTPASIPSSDRTLGNADAPVTVEVYGDFRCSACFVFTTDGTEASLVTNYVATGKAKLVWHDYLSIDALSGGTASRDAANAAWCAADQGKFWVMHDWLYANDLAPTEDPSAFTLTRLAAIAKGAGLDMAKFQPCLDAGTHDDAILAEMSATPSEVGGTPSIFVAGKFVPGATAESWPTFDLIKAAIDAALASPAPSAVPSVSPSATAS
jgi:protein-disulfide isomerase